MLEPLSKPELTLSPWLMSPLNQPPNGERICKDSPSEHLQATSQN